MANDRNIIIRNKMALIRINYMIAIGGRKSKKKDKWPINGK